MAQSIPSDNALDAPLTSPQRVIITNNHGEKLVGLLHETGSKKLVVLCHGFRSSKDDKIMHNLSAAITSKGLSVFRFDFSGNGESDGVFQYGNYWKEAEDLHSVVLFFSEQNYEINAIVGHSKGGDVVILYASRYHDVRTVINLSGRFALERGIEIFLGDEFSQRLKDDGFIDVKDKSVESGFTTELPLEFDFVTGKFAFRVTEESLMERLNIDMHAACLSIDNGCRVFTVHGSADEIIPVEDALEFAKVIPNHKLHIIEGANHCYTEHQDGLAKTVVDFLTSVQVEDPTMVERL